VHFVGTRAPIAEDAELFAVFTFAAFSSFGLAIVTRFFEGFACVGLIVDHTIAIIVEAIADLGGVVVWVFGAFSFIIAFEVFANAIRFIEVIARAAFIDHAIAVVVFAVAFFICGEYSTFAQCLPFAVCIAHLDAFFADADIVPTYL
jgi:hypothetical protein